MPVQMSESEEKPFLPTKGEVTQFGSGLVFLILHMAFHMSWLLTMSLLLLIPAGDRLPQVASRLFVFALSILVHYRLLKYKRSIFRRLFGGFVSEQFLDVYDPIVPEPKNMKAAFERNWYLGIVAALMLPIVSGAIDFSVPWVDARPSTGKYKWVNPILEWFRINPNTTHGLAWVLIIGSLGLFVFRLRLGWLRQSLASNEDVVQR